jgi:hypothetical protein
MTLYEKIVSLYNTLTLEDFSPFNGTITLRNESDGQGDYIAKWEHPTLQRPTDEQLAEIN